MLELSLLDGPVPRLVLLSGWAALLALVAYRGRTWWARRVPVAAVVGVLGAGAAKVGVDVLWRPFPDPLPPSAVLWTGLASGGLVLAVLRSRRGRRRRRVGAVLP